LQFSLQATSPETSGYTLVFVIVIVIIIHFSLQICLIAGSGYGQVAGSSEHSNEPSGSKKAGNCLTS